MNDARTKETTNPKKTTIAIIRFDLCISLSRPINNNNMQGAINNINIPTTLTISDSTFIPKHDNTSTIRNSIVMIFIKILRILSSPLLFCENFNQFFIKIRHIKT